MKRFFFYCILFLSFPIVAQTLIPLPQQIEQGNGTFEITKSTEITFSDKKIAAIADLLSSEIKALTNKEIVTKKTRSKKGNIHLSIDTSLAFDTDFAKKEGYELIVAETGVEIKAKTTNGLYYGAITLASLLPLEKEKLTLQETKIKDYPSFQWRGMMLDVARYFFEKEYIFKYLDMMARHKLNVFHWHLIDDCGWRIEIKKYPKLTEVGAWRKSNVGKERYGGFYTQQDIKEIVAYATARNITIVPEIEIPAHTQSALAAYPWLGCPENKTYTVPHRHSISPEIYCAGKETTYEFLEAVMDEVAELFPGKYIHVGGDEAKFKRWQESKECQDLMKKEGYTHERELQGHMTRRMQKYLQKKGKEVLGWGEILHCNVATTTGLMFWHKPQQAVEAAKKGFPIVNSNVRHTYFDTPESRLPGEPPCATWTPPVSLQKAYEWHPIPEEVTNANQMKHFLGVNGCVWSDRFLHNAEVLADKPGKGTKASEDYIDYLSLPRMSAIAEVGWTSKEKRNYDSFFNRMKNQYLRYDTYGYNYRIPTPEVKLSRNKSGELLVQNLKVPVKNATIRYTINGKKPSVTSPVLTGDLTLPKEQVFKTATFLENGKQSLAFFMNDDITKYAAYGDLVYKWSPKDYKKTVSIDLTGKINSNGTYKITFIYQRGRDAVIFDKASLVKNQKDTILSISKNIKVSRQAKKVEMEIEVKGYETGASFHLNIPTIGKKDGRSFGVICIKK